MTPLQPASEILLRHGSYGVTLRASLRGALALECLPGGIAGLWDEIARQKLPALYAVIRAGATDRQEAERLLSYAANNPLGGFLKNAQAACLALIVASLPMDQGEASRADTSANPMPLSQFFAELFSRATSWLHWPPSEVWNASVAEIITALEMQADRELRRAGNAPDRPKAGDAYTKDRLDRIEGQGFDPAFDRAGLHRLKERN